MKRPLIAVLPIILAVLAAPGTAAAQDPDPLALPFPDLESLSAIGEWSLAAQQTAHVRMATARAEGNRDEVSRVINRLDKARQHAGRLFRELQTKGNDLLRP